MPPLPPAAQQRVPPSPAEGGGAEMPREEEEGRANGRAPALSLLALRASVPPPQRGEGMRTGVVQNPSTILRMVPLPSADIPLIRTAQWSLQVRFAQTSWGRI